MVPTRPACSATFASEFFGAPWKNMVGWLMCWLPMVAERFSHFGRFGFAGGLVGSKPTWHCTQGWPTTKRRLFFSSSSR